MEAQEITQEYLKELLNYDTETGIFTWKERDLSLFTKESRGKTWNSRYSNKETGILGKRGYLRITINSIKYYAHRLAWIHSYGYLPKNQIDHINNIRVDNRICNLREATTHTNGQNLKKAPISNKSTGLLGASYSKAMGAFMAQIKVNQKNIYLGCFDTPEEAHEAYLVAKRQLHPYGTL